MHLRAAGEVVVGELALETVLMHDPVALLSLGSSPPVEDESLLHPDQRAGLGAVNLPVLPRGLPVPGLSGPVRPQPRRVLPVTEAVEVPFLLPHLRLLYKPQLTNPKTRGRRKSTSHYLFMRNDPWLLPGSSQGSHLLRSTSAMARPEKELSRTFLRR